MMSETEDYNASVISITGISNAALHFLANLYPAVFDSESIVSMIAELSHRPKVTWKTLYSAEEWLTSMDQSEGGSLFAVSMEGTLHTNRTGTWVAIDLKCPDGLNAVWAASDREVFAVGVLGERAHLVGESLTLTQDAFVRRLNAIHGTSSFNVFAAGDQGLVYRFDGKKWTELDPATNYNLLAVLCQSDKEIYVAGSNGVLLKWQHEGWEWLEAPDVTFTSLAWYEDTLYASAGGDGVYRLGKNGLEKIKELRIYRLRTIGNLLFGIGNKMVVQYNGSEWWGGDLYL